jgi:hypothetical protein
MSANIQKSVPGTEAANDALNIIVSKALGYPKKGSHIGGGVHVAIQGTYDGTGACPAGWTKQPTANWAASPASSAVPITDAMAVELQAGPAQALLSGAEQATLAAAILARANVDLEAGAFLPKS